MTGTTRWVGDTLPGPARSYITLDQFEPTVDATTANPGQWAVLHEYPSNRTARKARDRCTERWPGHEFEVRGTTLYCRHPA